MSFEELPDDENVVRYVGPRNVKNGEIEGAAFKPREVDVDGISADWMGAYDDPKENQLQEIRNRIRMKMKKTGFLAELNVGDVRMRVLDEHGSILQFIHTPLEAGNGYQPSPSHILVKGIPIVKGIPGDRDSDEAHPVCDLIARCILQLHPALKNS